MAVREVSAYLQVHLSIGSDWRFNIEAIDRWRLGKPKRGDL